MDELMTRLILFDLGDTLESADELRPGALETLRHIAGLRVADRPAALLGLLSDFTMTADPAQVPAIRQQYLDILDALGIREFFEPTERRVTLSTEVGVVKPAKAMFRSAVAKAEPALRFADVLFVTENTEHVAAARRFGMRAVAIARPGADDGDIRELTELIPTVDEFVAVPADEPRAGPELGPPGERLHL